MKEKIVYVRVALKVEAENDDAIHDAMSEMDYNFQEEVETADGTVKIKATEIKDYEFKED